MLLSVSSQRLAALGIFFLHSILSFSQSDCACSQCQIPIIADQTHIFSLMVSGAQSNELGQFGQGVCEVEIDFAHDFISDLEISLTSPAGVTVPLISSLSNNDTTYFSRWKIKFKRCGDAVAPDLGFLPIFKNNTNWPDNTTFTGDYTNNFAAGNECLENLDVGTVNGKWALHVTSKGYRGVGFIYGFKINFCKPSGIICSGLNYEVITGESCDTAAPLPTDVDLFVGNTAGFGPSMDNFFCGSIENDQWFTFVTNCTLLGFSITPGYCINGAGLQLALYDDCNASIPVACGGGCQTCGWQTQSITAQVVPGHQYYLLIDGWAGDQCDFTLDLTHSCIGGLGNPDPAPNLNGCQGSTQTVALTKIPFGAAGYIWKANNGALVNGQTQVTVPGPENLSVELTFGNGNGNVCVAAYNFTDTSDFVCFGSTADTTLLLAENAIICYKDYPYFSQYEPNGVPPLYAPGTYNFTLQDYQGPNGDPYPCPVHLQLNLQQEGGFSQLPPVIGLGTQYELPNGDEAHTSGPVSWSDTLASGCINDYSQSIYLVDWLQNGDGCGPDTITYFLPDGVWLECPGGVPSMVGMAGDNKVIYYNTGVFDLIGHVDNQTYIFKDTIKLNLAPPPQAKFTTNVNQSDLTLNNQSQNATSFLWDFGDGFSSTDDAPMHTYSVPGEYLITLIANGICGDSTTTQIVTIAGPAPMASFVVSQQAGCVPLVVQFQDLSTENPNAWLWQFPGGIPNTSTEQNPSVIYTFPGTYDATLRAKNAFGESTLAQTAIVSASPLPSVLYTMMPIGLEVVFTNQSQNAASYLWNFGDGLTSTEANPTHTYANPGDYLVTLQAVNTCGTSILQLWVSVMVSETSQPTSFARLSVSPNPSNGSIKLELLDAPSPNLSWRLFNALGQCIANRELGAFGGNYSGNLDFRHLPPAVYWLSVRTTEKRAWVKLVIE